MTTKEAVYTQAILVHAPVALVLFGSNFKDFTPPLETSLQSKCEKQSPYTCLPSKNLSGNL
ncbi:hypothetical protein BX616_010769 [Lobosporangium transversale]|nr:hypothetical protein BX616_010769 [Lobosporangium transversale]